MMLGLRRWQECYGKRWSSSSSIQRYWSPLTHVGRKPQPACLAVQPSHQLPPYRSSAYSTSHFTSTSDSASNPPSSSSASKSRFDTEVLTKSAKTLLNKATELFDIQYRRNIEKYISKTMPRKSMIPISNHKLLVDMIYASTFSMNIYSYHETFVQQCQYSVSHADEAKANHTIMKKVDSYGNHDIFSNDSIVLMNILPGTKDKETDPDSSLCCAYYIRPQKNTDTKGSKKAHDHIHQGDGTLWIVCRGTANAMDIITDATWMIKTEPIQDTNLDVAFLVGKRCNLIIHKLQPIIDLLQSEYDCEIQRIGFVGHSLGGAVATSLYTYYMLTNAIAAEKKFPAFTITIGAPLTYHKHIPFEGKTFLQKLLPDRLSFIGNTFAKFSKSTSSSKQEEGGVDSTSTQELMHNSIHNIVHNLDIVPRMVGAHKFPKYLLEGEIGKVMNKMMKLATVDREQYRTFGHYYSLRNPVTLDQIKDGFLNLTSKKDREENKKDMKKLSGKENKDDDDNDDEKDEDKKEKANKINQLLNFAKVMNGKSGILVEVKDPALFLSIFPDNLAEFAFSVTDHSIDKSVEDIHNVEIKGSHDVFAYLKEKLNFATKLF